MKRISITLILLQLFVVTAWAYFPASKVALADPFIFYENGLYYAYGTHSGNGIEVYTSSDLLEWELHNTLALHKDNTTETRWFWAPEVYHKGDLYYMYYSANEHLYVATSDSPLGPFVQQGTYQMNSILGDEKCIDSSVFFDDDGTAYQFFVRFTDGNCIWMCQLQDDYMTPVEGTLRHCISVGVEWEMKWGRVCEGPNIVKHNGIYYLTYSANDYQSPDYAVGYATTTSLTDGSWTKYEGNPIVHKVYDLVGTGHHTLFNDKDGKMRIVFHAHNSTTTVHDRLMYIGSMQFNGDKLEMAQEPIIRPVLKGDALPSNYIMPDTIDLDCGYEKGGAVTADLDSDGDLDILSGGYTRNIHNSAKDGFTKRRMMHIRMWDENDRKWNDLDGAASAIQVAESPVLLPCDINHDGVIDIVAFETIGTSVKAEAYKDDYGKEGIFLGNDDGTFRSATLSFIKEDDSYTFDVKGPSTAALLDIDNNGLMDIVCAGNQADTSYNVILRNKGFIDDQFTFEVIPYAQEYVFTNSVIQTCDFNNDGYFDFIISAKVSGISGMTAYTDIYMNDSEKPGTFTPLGLGTAESNVLRKSAGALQVADFNNDGLFDFFLSGNGDTGSGESVYTQKIYLNSEGEMPSFIENTGILNSDVYQGINSTNSAVGVIDWDGDNNTDIVIAGRMMTLGIVTGYVYTNNVGRGVMKRATMIPAAISQSIIFPDWNGDGVKDYYITGYSSDNMYVHKDDQGRCMIAANNINEASARPDAPTNCEVSVENDVVTLSWNAPESAVGNYTYEFFIKDADGNLVNDCVSHIGGELDGVRKTNTYGNAGCNTTIKFYPTTSSTFTWGVQAINASYQGSTFTLGDSFSSGAHGIASVSTDTAVEVARYNILGQPIDKNTQGIHIIKMSDGSFVKKIVKHANN